MSELEKPFRVSYYGTNNGQVKFVPNIYFQA